MNKSIFALIGVVFFNLVICPTLQGELLNELFIDASSSTLPQIKQDQAKQSIAVIQSRYVDVQLDYLAGKGLEQGVETIILNLFKNTSLTAIKNRLERRSEDCYTWFGHIEGNGYSHVILTVENGGMAGSIMFERVTYRIRNLGDGVHAIYEIDQSALEPFKCGTPDMLQEETKSVSGETPPTEMSDDGSLIDVMVVYTQDAANSVSNIVSEIQLAIDLTNQTYANSNINQRVRLVHSAQVPYTETGDSSTDLKRIKDPSDGYIDDVHPMRDTYGADIVSLWVNSLGDICGRGYMMDDSRLSNDFEKWAFNVISVDEEINCSIYTSTHEMGHNMGAHHDRYVCDEDDTGAYDYSYGYVSRPGEFRTIMAYWQECDDNGFYCERIPYWSNPDVTYEGILIGIPEGESDSANNTKTLNNTAYIVANFRGSVVSITSSIQVSTTTTSAPSCPSEQIYGEHSEETELLRYFRDNVLSKSPEGRELIKLYYEWSPAVAEMMEADDEFRAEVKDIIDGFLSLIE